MESQKNTIGGYFIKNYRVSILIGAIIVMGGILSSIIIPKESAPYIPYGIVNISTVYQGTSAKDIDQLITQELESKLKSVEGLNKMTSNSRFGLSNITLEFQPDQDMIKAVSDVKSKVDQTKSSLPRDLDQDPIVTEISSAEQAFVSVVLYGEESDLNLKILADKLKKNLEKISGVSKVAIVGGADKEIIIEITPEALNLYGLTITDLSNTLSLNNQNIPLGNIKIDKFNYNLRLQGQYQNLDQIKATVIKHGTESNLIKIGDVAKVYESAQEQDSIHRINLNKTSGNYIELTVYKSLNANIFNVNNSVHTITDKFAQDSLPQNVKTTFANEMAPITKDDFKLVITNGIQSVSVVLFILFIFVGIREALIAGLVIPLSFCLTIGFLILTGRTLNFMTNFSMILSLGILVDTAIVIVEGCHDFVKKGYDTKEAALLALKEFKGPLISGTLTTLAVFIPLFTLPGVLGKYLSFIPITVTVVLIASLLISLILIPSFASMLIKPHDHVSKNNGKFHQFNVKLRNFFNKVQGVLISKYYHFMRKAMPKRMYRIGIMYLIFALFFGSFMLPIKFELFPQGDAPFISVNVEQEIGTKAEVTSQYAQKAEEILLQQPEIIKIKTSITENTGSIYVELSPEKERKQNELRSSIDLSFDLQNQLSQIKGSNVTVQNAQSGPPSEAPVAFRVILDDSSKITEASKVITDIENILKKIPGTFGIKNDMDTTPGEIEYIIDREKVALLNINPAILVSYLRTFTQGITATSINQADNDTDIKIKYTENFKTDINNAENLLVPNMQGELIPLNQLVSYNITSGLNNIRHIDTAIAFTVSSSLTETGNAAEITAQALEEINQYKLPNGITIVNAGENEENADLFAALLSAFVIAMMIMYLILVIQFNSFLHPNIILSTIIFGMIGVNFGLYITDTPRSLAFILGAISLGGIVVNDAIIFVDQINKKLKGKDIKTISKQELVDAITFSGKSRFTPIILTTLTTVAGIGPLVLVDNFWAGLGYTIVFGLSVATFLTLFVTPAFYYQLEKEKMLTFGPLVALVAIVGGLAAIFATSNIITNIAGTIALGTGALFVHLVMKSYKKSELAEHK